ncbi:MAG: acetate--CoA ligase family protein [Anaerolineales bacterium]
MSESLLPFLHPKGVVVVGASTSPGKLGYGVARNLVQSGYTGAIHFVSHKRGRLFDRPVYRSLSETPKPVDLAVLVVPAAAVAQALRDCAARGIRAAIIASAGFREVGPDGAALEQECVDVARANGMRLLGPNCIGTIDTHFPLDTSFLHPPMPPSGAVAFVSHSGAFCAAVVDWSRRQGFGFSQIISVGNQADITETDVLPLVADDNHTRVIALYMEGVSNGPAFVAAATSVTRRKPVIALKVGRSQAGQKAAASHTAALAASDTAFDAAFERAGIDRASTAEQMFDWARALADCPLPQGGRVAILTDAGGPGVIAADAVERYGLSLAELAPDTIANLGSRLPEAASLTNPVDMLASASPIDYVHCLRLLLDDAGVDAVLIILPPPPSFPAETVAEAVIPPIRQSPKPVVIALLGSELIAPAMTCFADAHVPTYPFPERAISALAALSRRSKFLANPVPPRQHPNPPAAALPADNLDRLLEAYGITPLPMQLAHSASAAAAISIEMDLPVVMKIASPDIPHKSDVGGVVAGIGSPEAARSAYTQLVDAVHSKQPDAAIEGVFLQHQIQGGQEVIMGALRDPNFGPTIMFGSGGIEAEALGDVAFALAPLAPSEADTLVGRTWAGRRLNGFRSLEPVDRDAVRESLVGLSWLAHDHPELREIEINPLRVLRKGAFALDVRATRA